MGLNGLTIKFSAEPNDFLASFITFMFGGGEETKGVEVFFDFDEFSGGRHGGRRRGNSNSWRGEKPHDVRIHRREAGYKMLL